LNRGGGNGSSSAGGGVKARLGAGYGGGTAGNQLNKNREDHVVDGRHGSEAVRRSKDKGAEKKIGKTSKMKERKKICQRKKKPPAKYWKCKHKGKDLKLKEGMKSHQLF